MEPIIPTILPTLYKRSSTGALQQWDISVETSPEGYGVIVTKYGQVDGEIQEARDTVREGKNTGKANATTALQQAQKECAAKWRKQIENKGYVQDRTRAEVGENDIEIGISPMLATHIDDLTAPPKFPADEQRKFNGVRCLVEIDDGKVTLTSRKRKLFTSVPHIVAAYEEAFKNVKGHFSFDGELYCHGWSLQKISGFTRSKTPKAGFENLGHFVYDTPLHTGPWTERKEWLAKNVPQGQHIHLVETITVNSLEEAKAYQRLWVQDHYEGGILRVLTGTYQAGKRSKFLLKVKDFHEQEFLIKGVGEGRGKFEGKAVFECVTDEGGEFTCAAPGTMEDKAEFLANAEKLIGKKLTVKFFEWTEDRIPSQPVGCAVRDYE
jgi:DNA ligase 1